MIVCYACGIMIGCCACGIIFYAAHVGAGVDIPGAPTTSSTLTTAECTDLSDGQKQALAGGFLTTVLLVHQQTWPAALLPPQKGNNPEGFMSVFCKPQLKLSEGMLAADIHAYLASHAR